MPLPIRPKLDPVIPEHKLKERKDYNWSVLKAPAPGTPPIPRAWINPLVIPYVKPTRLNQDQRGTCTGFGETYCQLLVDVLLLMKNYPTSADISAIRRNVQIKKPGWTCIMFWDQIPDKVPSMEFNYEMGRREEWPDPNDRPPEGGMVDANVRAWKKVGWIPETWCKTAKTPNCVPWMENDLGVAEGSALTEASKHTIDGYATCNTPEEIAQAIYTGYMAGTGGVALVGVNIMSNFQQGSTKTVAGQTVYIFPTGTDVDGGHAQCIVGYDLDQQLLVTLSSWETDENVWHFLNGWSFSYHRDNASAAYVPIDASDVAVGQGTYSTVIINANVPCQFKVDAQTYLDMPTKISLIDGQQYTIIAYPNPGTAVETSITKLFVPLKANEVPGSDGKPIIPVDFVFTVKPGPTPDPTPGPDPTPTPPSNLWEWILAILKWIAQHLPSTAPTDTQKRAIQMELTMLSNALKNRR